MVGGTVLARLLRRVRPAKSLRLLIVDDGLPDPAMGAGAPRARGLIASILRTGARVTLYPTCHPVGPRADHDPTLAAVEAIAGGQLNALAAFLQQRHRTFDAFFVSRRHNLIAFNEALAQTPQIAVGKSIVFDSEAIFAEREEMQRTVTALPRTASDMTVAEEVTLARTASIVVAVNAHDAGIYRRAGFSDVRVLGHAIAPAPGATSFSRRADFLFVGPASGDASPNSDALVWFADRVLPLIRAGLDPGAMLAHVGHMKAPAVQARLGTGIGAKGPLRDLAPVYDGARVFVAPIRYAAGISWKVCEAASTGVPCVVTPVLARQLGWTHGREALVAETPEDFASQCIRLYTDETIWNGIRAAALAWIETDCDPDRFDRTVEGLCRAIRPA